MTISLASLDLLSSMKKRSKRVYRYVAGFSEFCVCVCDILLGSAVVHEEKK